MSIYTQVKINKKLLRVISSSSSGRPFILLSQEEMRQAKTETIIVSPDCLFLSIDLLTKIREELPIPPRVCFEATCRGWSSAVLPVVVPSYLARMVSTVGLAHSLSPTYGHIFTDSPLRELPGRRCVGAQTGWTASPTPHSLSFVPCVVSALTLVGLQSKDVHLHIGLLNPLTMTQVHLPYFTTFPNIKPKHARGSNPKHFPNRGPYFLTLDQFHDC